MFAEVLSCFVKYGLEDATKSKKVSEFLLSWSKASSFDMTLMFLEDNEKSKLAQIAQELTKTDKNSHASFKKVYINI